MNGLTRFAGLLGLVGLLGITCVRLIRPELVRGAGPRGSGTPPLDPTPIVFGGLALVAIRLIHLALGPNTLLVRVTAFAGIVAIVVGLVASTLLVTTGAAGPTS